MGRFLLRRLRCFLRNLPVRQFLSGSSLIRLLLRRLRRFPRSLSVRQFLNGPRCICRLISALQLFRSPRDLQQHIQIQRFFQQVRQTVDLPLQTADLLRLHQAQMAASPGDVIALRQIAQGRKPGLLLDPFFHHGEHARGDSVEDNAPYAGCLPAGVLSRHCRGVLFFIFAKALQEGQERPAHPLCVDDQNDRSPGLQGQVKGRGLHA